MTPGKESPVNEWLQKNAELEELLKEKTIELEQKNRELLIEDALERVRARTMVMQKSEELSEAASLLFRELQSIEKIPDRLGIVNYDEENKVFRNWITDQNGIQVTNSHTSSIHEPTTFNKVFRAWKENKDSLIIELSGNELKEWLLYVKDEMKLQINESHIKDRRIHYAAFHSYGFLMCTFHEPLKNNFIKLFIRFAKVFEQTYTRFLDLKQAENQAREAQIEAALERVRSKTMAMHNSQDVGATVVSLFDEVLKLGIDKSIRCGIGILDKETDHMETRSATSYPNGEVDLKIGLLDMRIHPMLVGLKKAWNSGKKSYSYDYIGDDVYRYYEALNNEPEYPFQADLDSLPENEYHISFIFPEGILFTFAPNPISDEAANIFTRFAGVFGQTYRRYQDLKKAEEQAREAQIEASLERIRAQVTAMQESSELLDIVVRMRSEFVSLGHEAHYFWYMRYLPEKYEKAMTSGDGTRIGMVMSLPRHIHGDIKLVADWEKSDEPTLVFAMDVDTAVDYIHKMITLGDFVQVDPNAPTLDDIRHIGGLTFIMARTTNGEIGFSLPGAVPDPPQESLDTLVRFAGVFDLAHRRFEDLLSAERQNRETQIELALERVRSKAMAMNTSEDLGVTVDVFFSELLGLNISPHRCGVGIVDGKSKIVRIRAIDTNQDKESRKIVGDLKLAGHPVLDKIFDSWVNQEEYFPVLCGKEILEYYKVMNPQVAFHDFADDEVQYGYYFYFKEGGVYAWTDTELEEQDIQIFRRYTSVLSLTYRRYLDLKDAELQAKEAIKQASLDRVRGQIASMRSTDDLQRITPLIWHELETLEVPFSRCGVFIVDELNSKTQAYLTTPEGKPLGVLNLSNDSNELTKTIVGHWRKKAVHKIHWNKDDFISWMQSMIDLGQVENREEYQGNTAPPESLDLHFIPFAQGMLYVGYKEPLPKNKIELVKSLAETFAVAYSRYEDFKQLEGAKNKVEITLNDLKSTQTQLIHAEKMASLGELTAGIAHEIQNPLNFVNNFAEVNTELIEELKEEVNNGEFEEVKAIANDISENEQKIKHHGMRAEAIVKGMLQHSRTSNNQKELADLNALSDEYLRLAYHGLRAKDKSFNADFKTDFDKDLPKIMVVQQDIGRVLLNLINNAFYAVSEASANKDETFKPKVIVSTKKLDDKIQISVQDNGNGIPPGIIDKIFQPFFTTKPTTEGTGLGLSMSYDIITNGHSGELKVQTKDGEGTELIIILPVNQN